MRMAALGNKTLQSRKETTCQAPKPSALRGLGLGVEECPMMGQQKLVPFLRNRRNLIERKVLGSILEVGATKALFGGP